MASDYSKICRLCLSAEKDLISIGSILMLYDKIMQLINIPLFDGDGLPSTICSGCCKRISEFFKFRETVQSNFYILQKYHLLPQKSQSVIDFISTHIRFQENETVSSQINTNIREINSSNEQLNNILQNDTERENTVSTSQNEEILINHITVHENINDQNTISRSENNTPTLELNESINIKQEIVEQDFIQVQQVESLSCTPDIFKDMSSNSSSIVSRSSLDMDLVRIPENYFEDYSSDEDESSNETHCEPMFKRIRLPSGIKLKECKIILEDCIKSRDKENIAVNVLNNERIATSFTVIKKEYDDPDFRRRMSSYSSFKDKPDPRMINRKLSPQKKAKRNSFPLNNKFLCSLCQKTFTTSQAFREHIKNHTLKRMFEMTKQKTSKSGYKFNNSQYNKTK